MNKEVGIYKIECLANGKMYIGSSIMLTHRLKNHVYMLNKQKHRNGRLQNAWNKYGQDKFVFDILFNCDKAHMRDIEVEFMEMFDSAKCGFNISLDTISPMQGVKHSEAALKKMRDSRVGLTYSDEAKAKISKSLSGRVLSEEHKHNISTGGKGIKKSEATKQRMRESATIRDKSQYEKMGDKLRGVPKSEAHKANMRLSAIARANTPEGIARLRAMSINANTEERRAAISVRNIERMKDPEARASISRALTGRKASPETRAKLRAAHLGKKISEEQKLLLSKLATARWAAKKAAQI